MGFINKYPYVDFHELNADALIAKVDDAAGIAEGLDDRVTTLENDVGTITPIVNNLNSDMYEPVTGVKDRADNSWAVCSSNTNRIIILENDNITQGTQIGNLGYSLADPFRVDQAYSTGDYVINDDTKRLYKAIVDIPAGTGDINDLSQFYPTTISAEVEANELPEVTPADYGSFLAVDENGEWGLDSINLPISSGTIPYTHANITANAYWERVGNVVTVTTLFHADYTGLSGDLFTLPYPPKSGFGIYVRPSSNNYADLQGWVSGSNGAVSISTTTNAGLNYGVSFSYVVA